MASAADLAQGRYNQVGRLQRALVATIQRIWRGLSPATIASDLEGEAGAAILRAVVTGQWTVAQGAQAFVAAAMAEQGGTAAPEALLAAEAFVGLTPDGPLETLLYVPALGVQRRLAAGLPARDAMLGGLADMARYAATAVADTARSSTQVAMAADRQCVAYTRVVNLPACSRCIVLAGQQYAYSEGFLRHPNCDCTTVPLREADWSGVQSPRQLFDAMSPEQQRRAFTVAGAEAIREGADVGQVVNARRGMDAPGAASTREGTTRRGWYGRRAAGGGMARLAGERYARTVQARLTPEEIFRQTQDRGEQLQLLRANAYLS